MLDKKKSLYKNNRNLKNKRVMMKVNNQMKFKLNRFLKSGNKMMNKRFKIFLLMIFIGKNSILRHLKLAYLNSSKFKIILISNMNFLYVFMKFIYIMIDLTQFHL